MQVAMEVELELYACGHASGDCGCPAGFWPVTVYGSVTEDGDEDRPQVERIEGLPCLWTFTDLKPTQQESLLDGLCAVATKRREAQDALPFRIRKLASTLQLQLLQEELEKDPASKAWGLSVIVKRTVDRLQKLADEVSEAA